MAHTPMTRPPNRKTDRARPPKGPRVALRPEDEKRLKLLKAAATTCREAGKPDQAEVLDFVLGPQGAAFIKRVKDVPPVAERTNLPMRMPLEYRELIKQRAADAGDSLEAEVTHAIGEFLAGRFEPELMARAPWGSGHSMVNLNVYPADEAARRRADAECKTRRDRGERIYTSNVAADWLLRKYKVGRYADAQAE